MAFVGQIAVDDQAEDRGLYTAYRQHAFDTLDLSRQRTCAGHIETVQLITDAAGQSFLVQAEELAIITQALQRLSCSIGIEVIDQDTFDRCGVAVILQHLLHQQLSFVVRVACMHDLGGFADQLANNLQLQLGFGDRLVFLRPQLER